MVIAVNITQVATYFVNVLVGGVSNPLNAIRAFSVDLDL